MSKTPEGDVQETLIFKSLWVCIEEKPALEIKHVIAAQPFLWQLLKKNELESGYLNVRKPCQCEKILDF